jgi:hypothetical protein
MPLELEIPPKAIDDPDSFELIRVWAASGSQHVTIIPNFGGGCENFGALVADLIRHGARLYSQRENIELRESLERIVAAMRRELTEQGNTITGSIGHDA